MITIDMSLEAFKYASSNIRNWTKDDTIIKFILKNDLENLISYHEIKKMKFHYTTNLGMQIKDPSRTAMIKPAHTPHSLLKLFKLYNEGYIKEKEADNFLNLLDSNDKEVVKLYTEIINNLYNEHIK